MKATFCKQHPGLLPGGLYGIFVRKDKTILGECQGAAEFLAALGTSYTAAPGQAFAVAVPCDGGAAHLMFCAVEDTANAESWRDAAGALVREAYKLGFTKAYAALPQDGACAQAFVRGMTEGAAMAAYRFDEYKTVKKPAFAELCFCGGADESLQMLAEEACVVCEEVNFARSLVDEIGSVLTPDALAERVRERAEKAGVECEIWDENKIRSEGMGALDAVASGSAQPPRLIILRYNGAPGSTQKLGLVGKGVTFDTGGYCLKPGSGMMDMKDDMGGAAAVIGALLAAARRKLAVNLVAVVGACENSIDVGGFKPGDIVKTLKGTTVEVINTDAEGRITLADTVYFAAVREKATHLVDAATLTGSAISTFGSYYTAVVTSDQAFYNEFQKAAAVSGEYFWQLPCDARYRKLLDSKVADMKNLAGREGGCIIAGMFIKEFTEGLPWIHLDLCGAYYGTPRDSYVTDLATGQPVRTLYELAKLMQND